MLFRHTILTAAFLASLTVAVQADPPRTGIDGGGYHALNGGGHHALGGGVHFHSGHHHHHHGAGSFGFGGGYYGGFAGFNSFYSGPGYFSYSAPGYSFFSGATTVLPAPVWSPPVGGGYYYSPSGYYLNPYGPVIERPGGFEAIPADEQAVFENWLDENRRAWEAPVEELPIEQRPRRFLEPSTEEARLRSIRHEHEGDLKLRDLQYNLAARQYQAAIAAAPDRAEPYFRLAVSEAAYGNFLEAVRHLKQGVQLDAAWPRTATGLEELLGDDSLLARTLIKQRVADWTREDIRDPDRLFLLGVLLYLDGDDRSATLFESAARLGGMSFHLAAFLRGEDLLQRAEAEEAREELTRPVPSVEPAAEPEIEPAPPLLPPLPEPEAPRP